MPTDTPQDPMRGTDLPPVPPTAPPAVPIGAPLPITTQPPRAALGDTIGRHTVDLNAAPLPGDDPLTVAMVSEHVVEVDERLALIKKRVDRTQGAVFVACVIGLAAMIIGICLTFAVNDLHQQISSARMERLASDTERARVDGLHRNAICATDAALKVTYSAAARKAYPLGTGAFDDFYSRLTTSMVTLACDAG